MRICKKGMHDMDVVGQYNRHCRACQREYSRLWKAAALKKAREYVMASQGDSCAVCGETATHLDHDHKTNLNRGMLCTSCNMAIGLFHDNPELLRAAADYLETPKMLGKYPGRRKSPGE